MTWKNKAKVKIFDLSYSDCTISTARMVLFAELTLRRADAQVGVLVSPVLLVVKTGLPQPGLFDLLGAILKSRIMHERVLSVT